jgi:hypothetical protein
MKIGDCYKKSPQNEGFNVWCVLMCPLDGNGAVPC